jgi:ABC-type polysaccharide/polyol phosphate export permease
MAFNPMAGVIEGYRSALFGRDFDWFLLGISFFITMVVFVFAIVLFRHMEKEFADII